MNERDTLRIVLWVLSASFTIKAIVFETLAWVMFRQTARTPVGRALKWHYFSIGTQAILLAVLYAHYARALGGSELLPYEMRRVFYPVVVVSVFWVISSGLYLIYCYWRSRAVYVERGRLQDVRDVDQQDRSDRQDRRDTDWEASHE